MSSGSGKGSSQRFRPGLNSCILVALNNSRLQLDCHQQASQTKFCPNCSRSESVIHSKNLKNCRSNHYQRLSNENSQNHIVDGIVFSQLSAICIGIMSIDIQIEVLLRSPMSILSYQNLHIISLYIPCQCDKLILRFDTSQCYLASTTTICEI